MNYKEKYEKALERAKVWRDKSGMPKDRQGVLDDIFPELKESEDERIRKEILDYLVSRGFSNEWIAWLEKQGEQNLANSAKICKDEPKFKVGDWVVSARGTAHIIGIGVTNSEFLLEYTDGDQESLSVEYVNSTYTKWTIQRAWDGDVLVCSDDKRPFIFKGLLDQIHPNCPVAYCGIDLGHNFIASHDDSWWTSREVKPATKEQQDYLFQKMGEAGYMWEGHTKKLICK